MSSVAVGPTLLNLRWRATFIDVSDDMDKCSEQRRGSKTVPCLPTLDHQDVVGFLQEQAYVQSLAAKLSDFNRPSKKMMDSDLTPVPEASSLPSTAPSAGGGQDAPTDSVSDVHREVNDVDLNLGMQAAQINIRTVGHQLSAIPMPVGAAVPEDKAVRRALHTAVNSTVADKILQIKADTFSSVPSQIVREHHSEQIEVTSTEASATNCNSGSIGHPELCNRPCLYHANAACSKGMACEYCHFSHSRRPAHLDKRHRDMLRQMTHEECASVVLPLVKARVQNIDTSPTTQQLLADVFTSCGQRLGAESRVTAQSGNLRRSQRMLVLTLRSMSLKTLLSSVQRAMSQHCTGIENAFEALVSHLRRLAALSASGTVQSLLKT